jgi:photosystem II stability/assembly factor-like uncharacterized protein
MTVSDQGPRRELAPPSRGARDTHAGGFARRSPHAGGFARRSSHAGGFARRSSHAGGFARRSSHAGGLARRSSHAGGSARHRAIVAVMAVVAVMAIAACQDTNRIELRHDAPPAPPRLFSWKLVTETAEMADGVFATDREAWVVGPYGTILHTSTGGAARADWQVVESGTTAPLDRIAAVATPGGAFALATGTNVVLRYTTEHPGWEPLDLNPASGRRPVLHVTADGQVEAWLATLDGFAYASDARSGAFAKAAVPPGATDIVFSDEGDSWTVAPVGTDCVAHRRAHGEVDWHAMPVPPRPPPARALSTRATGLRLIATLAVLPRVRACGYADLFVTLQRKKLWLVVNDTLSEWDGAAWTSYGFPDDLAAARPAGGISDTVDTNDVAELVLFPKAAPPTAYPRSAQAAPNAPARKDPHERALAAWAKARSVKFSVTDLWMRDREIWAVGREGVAHATDGGQTWSVAPIAEPARPPAASFAGHGGVRQSSAPSLRKLAFNEPGTQGWAVSDDGDVFRYDGAWHAQLKIGAMQRALALNVSNDGNVAWLLTRDRLYRMTTAGSTIAASDDRASMETLTVCPDGRSGWARYGGYQWYAFDGTAWTKVAARPALACLPERCASALAQADPSTVVCAGDQIWSLRQGQTADGTAWRYPIPGLEPQSRVAQIWANNPASPTQLIAVRPDGDLLRTDAYADQPAVVEPRATIDGAQVELSWALAGTTTAGPTWVVEYCVVYSDGICAGDSAAWVGDNGIQQRVDGGRYFATVTPSKLSLQPDTRVQYRVRVTLGDLRRAPMVVAEITLGETAAAAAWGIARLYVASAALWIAVLLALWLIAPRRLLNLNDAVRKWLSQFSLLGNAVGDLAGVVLARRLIRTPRVVASWIRHELRAPDPARPIHDQPTGFASLADLAIRGRYQAMATCQQAWIQLHLERAEKTFDGSKFAAERTAYGEASARIRSGDATRELAKGVGLEDMRELVAPVAADPKLVLWICGQGGVGKSHLACRIARWLAKQALLPHPAIVVVIDGNTETRDALEAMIRARLEALTQATDIDDGLVGQLLASGSVVLLFDGLTERSPRTIDAVTSYLESPKAPALTICTARAPHGLTARRSVTLEPMLLDVGELLPFLSSYRRSLPADRRHSEALLEPVRQAAKRIAEAGRQTRLTPLLVMLLWDEAVDGAAFSGRAVDAFNGYVARALVPAGNAPDVADERRLALVRARVLGRLALGKNYRPGRWFTRDAAIRSLQDAGVAAADHDVLHDFTAAGLLEEDGPDGHQLRFLLDPLSETLCALWILYSYDGNDPDWDRFLTTLEALSPEARLAADGFLIALADGWAAHGASLQLTRAPRVDDVLPPAP